MIRKGENFPLWGQKLPTHSFFEGIELLYFTDTSFGNFLLHDHNDLEIILILDGNVEMLIEDVRYSVPQGSLITIPIHQTHHTIIPPQTKRYERIVLHIFPEYLEVLAEQFFLDRHRFDFCHEVHILEYTPDSLWTFRTMFERAFHAQSQNSEYQRIVIPCLMIELFMELELRIKNQASPSLPITNNLVSAVVDYIDEHFSEAKLSMEQICSSVYVSQGYLSRVFKSYTGTSVYSYLLYKRLIYAKHLLANGSNVLDACMSCGFSDYTCFLKAFKRAYRQTPSAFCRQHHKDNFNRSSQSAPPV